MKMFRSVAFGRQNCSLTVMTSLFTKLILMLTLSLVCYTQTNIPGTIIEYPIVYPPTSTSKSSMAGMDMNHHGSTHETTFDEKGGQSLWITGQNDDAVVQFDLKGNPPAFYKMDEGSGPHGIEFDAAGKLWITLEFTGKIIQFDPYFKPKGKILKEYDVILKCATCGTREIITYPHGLGLARDGSLWFTGKATGTIGKITPSTGKVETFNLPKGIGSVPIYIKEGPDGNMWFTELYADRLGKLITELRP